MTDLPLPQPLPPPPGDGKMVGDYLQGRAIALNGSSDAWMKALVQPQPAPAPGAPAPAPPSKTSTVSKNADGSISVNVQDGTPPAAPPTAAPGPSLPIGNKILNGMAAASRAPLSEKVATAEHVAGSAASDIGHGALDAPKQIIGGVLDYGNNLMRFAEDVGSKLDIPGVTDLYFRLFDQKGNWSPNIQTKAEYEADLASGKTDVFKIPTTGGSDAVTGKIIRAGTTFMVGRMPFLKAPGAAALPGVVRELGADFGSGVVGGVDPNERLSNIIDKAYPNFITDWLKAKPGEEDALLGRLKAGLEMGGMGAAFAGAKVLLGAIKGAPGAENILAADPAYTAAAADGPPQLPGVSRETPAAAPVTPNTNPGLLASEAGSGQPPKQGLAPAILDENGLVHYGQPGDVHSDIAERMQPGVGALAQNADKWQAGFSGPDGQFLTRSQAAQAIGSTGDLHALVLNPDTIPGVRPGTRDAANEAFPAATGLRLGSAGPKIALSFEPSPEAGKAAADFLDGKSGTNPVKINLDYVQAPQDIKDMVERLSTLIPSGDVQSHDATDQLAKGLGMTPDDLLHGIQGQAPSAPQMRAMALINISAAQRVGEYVDAYLQAPSADGQAAAIRALTVQYAIQQSFQGAKTETARALNILQMVRGPQANYAEAVGKIVDGVAQKVDGGDLHDLFGKISDLGNPAIGGDPAKVAAFIGKTTQPGMVGRSAMLTGWYNILLSNPRTVIKKFASDTGMAMWNLATRAYAENYGASGDVQPGETAALAYGYVSSVKDAVRMAGRGLTAGESQFMPNFGTADAFDAVKQGLFTPDGAPDVGAARASRLAALSGMDPGPVSFDAPSRGAAGVLRAALPTSWIAGVDDFWKYMNYNAERHALIYRDGMSKGLTGDDLSTHIAGLIDNTPPAIHEQAVSSALKTTFQEPLAGVAASMQQMVDGMNIPIGHTEWSLPVGRVIMPFIKVPLNIAKWSYQNSPLAAAFPSSQIREQLAAGGATRDLAIAKMTLGSTLALGISDLALNGVITGRGPGDPQLQRAWRDAGNLPYSVKLNGTQYGYNQIEPVGLMAGAIADTFDIMKFAKEDGRGNLAASMAFGIGNSVLSKTYMQGTANFFDALMHPDSEGGYYADHLLQSFAVPSGVRGIAAGMDEWRRAHYGLIDGIEASLPQVSKGLPLARTLWGDPIPMTAGYLPFLSGGGLARAVSPVTMEASPENNPNVQPIDKWIWNNRGAFPQGASNKLGITKPGIVQNFPLGPHISTQVELSPEQLDRFQVLAGNGLKDPQTGLGARDYLNTLVQGNNPDSAMQQRWNEGSPGVKAIMVQAVVGRFRDSAKKSMLSPDSPYYDQQLLGAVQAGWAERANTMVPQ